MGIFERVGDMKKYSHYKIRHNKVLMKRNAYHNKSSTSWGWVLLILLMYIGVGFIIYTANLLNNHHIHFNVGIGIITITSIVILCNLSVVMKWHRRVTSKRIIATIASSTLIALVMLAYAGITPFSTGKNEIVSFIHNINRDSSIPYNGSESTPIPIDSTTTAAPKITPIARPIIATTVEWIGTNGETEHEYLWLLGGDGKQIELFNNPQAHDPSWDELIVFLASDTTDKHVYIYGSFVCANFAEMLHNNAEVVGIRAAYVLIDLSGYTDPYNLGIPSSTSHALNVFNTTDKGLVYIDDTAPISYYPCSADKKVTLLIGSEYIVESIFPCYGWDSIWDSLGTVTNIDIQW